MKFVVDYNSRAEESARHTIFGRSSNNFHWIHEIPPLIDLLSPKDQFFRNCPTLFSGKVYQVVDNNTFMLFALLWLKKIRDRFNIGPTDTSRERWTGVLKKFGYSIVPETEEVNYNELLKQIYRFEQNRQIS